MAADRSIKQSRQQENSQRANQPDLPGCEQEQLGFAEQEQDVMFHHDKTETLLSMDGQKGKSEHT